MKKLIAVIMLVGVFVTVFGSYNVVEASSYGDFVYSKNSFSGVSGYIITDYTGPGGDVVIPATINGVKVEMIGNSAFMEKGITSVYIPDTVIKIWSHAFTRNYQLKSIYIPASVQKIKASAFWFCNDLEYIYCGANERPSGYETLSFCSAEFVFGVNRDGKTEEDLRKELEAAISAFNSESNYYTNVINNTTNCNTEFYNNIVLAELEQALQFDTLGKTTAQVENATSVLLNKGNAFELYINAMNRYISTCEAASAYDKEKYTSESWNALQNVLKTDINNYDTNQLLSHILSIEGAVFELKPLCVLGDVNGNGEIEKYDYILVKRAVLKTVTLNETQLLAANVNGKDGVEKYDYILVKRHVMGTFVISQ